MGEPGVEPQSTQQVQKTRGSWRLRSALALVSFFCITYWLRPDAMQALHWWPLSLWTPVMLLPWVAIRFWRPWKQILMCAALWIGLVLLIGEPRWSIIKEPAESESQTKVVSLNCGGGLPEAAAEAFSVDADLVLLQEVGGKQEFIDEGLRRGYKYVVWSWDDAIFAKTPITNPIAERDFAAGTVELNGKPVRVVSLRLLPPVFRLDLWNPECWRTYSDDIRTRRARFSEIAAKAKLEGLWIAGGDFNATNPRIVRDSHPGAREALRSSMVTWMGTGTNDYPLAPVDQIWASGLDWQQAEVRRTVHSDHRMVIASYR